MSDTHGKLFSKEGLEEIFPSSVADTFFEAMYGCSSEGAYDIHLEFKNYEPERKDLNFEFHLTQRPGKCLACNLTYGLPHVFSRHPIIDIQGRVQMIVSRLNGVSGRPGSVQWRMGSTREISRTSHIIPLIITLETDEAGA